MGMAGATVGVRSSSFLADAVRETATNHCIDRVVNGSLDGTVAVVSKKPLHFILVAETAARCCARSGSLRGCVGAFKCQSNPIQSIMHHNRRRGA